MAESNISSRELLRFSGLMEEGRSLAWIGRDSVQVNDMQTLVHPMIIHRRFLIGAILLIVTSYLASSKDEKPHPIDRFFEDCVDKNASTAGMLECTENAYKKWDAELNRVYGELLKKLSPGKATALKKAQRDWLTYRESEFKLIDSLYSGMQGTMYIPAHAYARLRTVRERTLLLTQYLELTADSE